MRHYFILEWLFVPDVVLKHHINNKSTNKQKDRPLSCNQYWVVKCNFKWLTFSYCTRANKKHKTFPKQATGVGAKWCQDDQESDPKRSSVHINKTETFCFAFWMFCSWCYKLKLSPSCTLRQNNILGPAKCLSYLEKSLIYVSVSALCWASARSLQCCDYFNLHVDVLCCIIYIPTECWKTIRERRSSSEFELWVKPKSCLHHFRGLQSSTERVIQTF